MADHTRCTAEVDRCNSTCCGAGTGHTWVAPTFAIALLMSKKTGPQGLLRQNGCTPSSAPVASNATSGAGLHATFGISANRDFHWLQLRDIPTRWLGMASARLQRGAYLFQRGRIFNGGEIPRVASFSQRLYRAPQ